MRPQQSSRRGRHLRHVGGIIPSTPPAPPLTRRVSQYPGPSLASPVCLAQSRTQKVFGTRARWQGDERFRPQALRTAEGRGGGLPPLDKAALGGGMSKSTSSSERALLCLLSPALVEQGGVCREKMVWQRHLEA